MKYPDVKADDEDFPEVKEREMKSLHELKNETKLGGKEVTGKKLL